MGFTNGENVGPYRIITQLGSGGMATVYKAYHAGLDRYVAIKVMHQALKEDPNFLARFQREARIVAKLEHPHIVPVYDFNEHDGQPYLVMRFVEGETLKGCLRADKLTFPQVIDIMRPVCQALAYAHDQGVLHRDIKPSNVLITPQGDVFLTDFGLAKIAQTGESTLSQDMMVGTPQYISPEQAQGRPDLDVRTDIYSLGVVLYELLVGRVPFQADTPYAVVHDHIFSPLPMPRSLNPALPEPFERVLLKALAKERDDRYLAVNDLLDALEKAFAESVQAAPTVIAPAKIVPEPAVDVADVAAPVSPAAIPVEPAPPKPAPKSRRALWVALAGVGLLLFCVAAFFLVTSLSGRAQLQSARKLRDQGQVDQALAQYDAARQANRRLLAAYGEPAEMLMARGQPGDFLHAAQLCEGGLSIAPNDAQLRMCASNAWIVANDLENAVPHLEWLIENRPADAPPHAGMAFVLLQHGQLDEAEGEANQALARDGDSPEGHLALGAVYLRKGQPLLARDQFRIVLDSPTVPRWIKDRAERLINGPN
jgi:tRNA A-37 threonylcarbamoyl transferase component Bud32/Flp pilus assembly protein TadD